MKTRSWSRRLYDEFCVFFCITPITMNGICPDVDDLPDRIALTEQQPLHFVPDQHHALSGRACPDR